MKKRMMIVGLSKDRVGLLVKTSEMANGNYWHVHSDEMTAYQRKVHRRLSSDL
jgi:hypothetical protein